jgi:hypothetical protein
MRAWRRNRARSGLSTAPIVLFMLYSMLAAYVVIDIIDDERNP